MANYPKELTDLLEQYLTDGILTAKERTVLLRKAETLGIDTDEFDLYIDAEVQKIDLKADAAKRQAKGKLCPFCESQVPMLADKCPECGSSITPTATKEVEEIITALEIAVSDFKVIGEKKRADATLTIQKAIKAYFKFVFILPLFFPNTEKKRLNEEYAKKKSDVDRYTRKAKMYYRNNQAINFLIEEIEQEKMLIEKSIMDAKRNKRMIIYSIIGVYILISLLSVLSL